MSIDIPIIEMGKEIPKMIFQTHTQAYNKLPKIFKENINSIKEMNPEHQYVYFDSNMRKKFILNTYGENMLKIYNLVNKNYGAARADFFRYLLMYAKGGIYIDLKSTFTRPLKIKPGTKYILSHWFGFDSIFPEFINNPYLMKYGEFQQWNIITVKGHPFLRKVIERIVHNVLNYNILIQSVAKRGVLRVTGPIAYSIPIDNIKHNYDYLLSKNIEQDFGIKYSIFDNMAHENHVSNKHYSKLVTPIVYPHRVKDYINLMIFYPLKISKNIFKIIMNKLISRNY